MHVNDDPPYLAVSWDLEYVRSILADGGVLAGDDWSWNSVRLAVKVGLRGSQNFPKVAPEALSVKTSGYFSKDARA